MAALLADEPLATGIDSRTDSGCKTDASCNFTVAKQGAANGGDCNPRIMTSPTI